MKKLGQIASVQMGYSFRSRLEPEISGSIAVIQMKDIDEANQLHMTDVVRVDMGEIKEHHLIKSGDLAFKSRGNRFSAAVTPSITLPTILAAPMLVIRPHGALPEYLCWYINAPATQAQLAALAEGTSVRMISAEALKALEVPLPALAVQHCIAEAAALAEQEQALLARIATLRRRLTTHLLMKLAHPSPERAAP